MSVKHDMSADDLCSTISEFSTSPGHGCLTALAIMSHGDGDGNILDIKSGSTCSVQQIVDALCHPDLQSMTKLSIHVNV